MIDPEKVKALKKAIWDCYNQWNEEGYVTDEFSDFADKVEDLTTYLSKELNLN